jgi:hypothetical protein
MTLDHDHVRTVFRAALLTALDNAARNVFNRQLGASDQDLPRLFAALDAQIETLAERYDATLVEALPAATALRYRGLMED